MRSGTRPCLKQNINIQTEEEKKRIKIQKHTNTKIQKKIQNLGRLGAGGHFKFKLHTLYVQGSMLLYQHPRRLDRLAGLTYYITSVAKL